MIIDLHLPMLVGLLKVLDECLERLERERHLSPDPESSGVFDSMEEVAGLGFVVCQTYLTAHSAQSGLKKTVAYECGPRHSGGNTVASVLNAAANYWKHCEEWSVSSPSLRERTVENISSFFGLEWPDYVLYNLLYELLQPLPTNFASLVPLLVQWRDSLRSAGVDPV